MLKQFLCPNYIDFSSVFCTAITSASCAVPSISLLCEVISCPSFLTKYPHLTLPALSLPSMKYLSRCWCASWYLVTDYRLGSDSIDPIYENEFLLDSSLGSFSVWSILLLENTFQLAVLSLCLWAANFVTAVSTLSGPFLFFSYFNIAGTCVCVKAIGAFPSLFDSVSAVSLCLPHIND